MKVYNFKNNDAPKDAIRIDRRSKWGNPYIIGKHGDRDYVCEAYMEYARNRLVKEPTWLFPLRGKDLVCWCKPQRCHGDFLLLLANYTCRHCAGTGRVLYWHVYGQRTKTCYKCSGAGFNVKEYNKKYWRI